MSPIAETVVEQFAATLDRKSADAFRVEAQDAIRRLPEVGEGILKRTLEPLWRKRWRSPADIAIGGRPRSAGGVTNRA